jgi:hypothetical protein
MLDTGKDKSKILNPKSKRIIKILNPKGTLLLGFVIWISFVIWILTFGFDRCGPSSVVCGRVALKGGGSAPTVNPLTIP